MFRIWYYDIATTASTSTSGLFDSDLSSTDGTNSTAITLAGGAQQGGGGMQYQIMMEVWWCLVTL